MGPGVGLGEKMKGYGDHQEGGMFVSCIEQEMGN